VTLFLFVIVTLLYGIFCRLVGIELVPGAGVEPAFSGYEPDLGPIQCNPG